MSFQTKRSKESDITPPVCIFSELNKLYNDKEELKRQIRVLEAEIDDLEDDLEFTTTRIDKLQELKHVKNRELVYKRTRLTQMKNKLK